MEPLPLGRCSEKNSVGKCSRWAVIICSHCNQGICSGHYEIHQQNIQIRLDKLNNQINDFRQILHTLTYEKIIENSHDKLNQWADKCKKEIDKKHAQMSDELLKKIQSLNIEEFRRQQLNYIDQHIGQSLTDIIRMPNNIQMKQLKLLEEQIQDITSFIQIQDITSFIQIKDNQIYLNNQSKNLFTLFKQHSLTDCPGAMAGSALHHNYLLIFQSKPSFSLVFIEDNKHLIRTSIDYFVYDICWSQSTQVFLVATEYYLYEYYPLNNRLSKPYGNINSSRKLWSLNCNLTNLYIVHQPDMIMYERDLKKPFEKKRKWLKNEIMCEKGDEMISSIRIDEQKQILGLSIKQIDHRWRVDLFSIDNMQRLYHGSSFAFNSKICMITPLLNHDNQWLVQHSTQTTLLDEKGQVINEIDRNGYNITLVSRDKIAFLNTFGIEIYQR